MNVMDFLPLVLFPLFWWVICLLPEIIEKSNNKKPKEDKYLEDYRAKANRSWIMEKPDNVRERKHYK